MRSSLSTIVAVLACLALPASAPAAVSITSFTLTPSTTQAGAHPNVTVDAAFSLSPSSDDVKSLGVVLPQGLVGDPNAADRCPISAFQADNCPATARVGSTTASVTAAVIPGVIEIPQDAPGDVYNLTPRSGEPARLGIVLRPRALNAVDLPKVFLQSSISVGPDTDYGLKTEFDGLPRTAGPFQIRVNRLRLVLNGRAARGNFLTNPTSCRPARTTADARSYAEPNTPRRAAATFTPTGCDRVPFRPRLSGSMGGQGTTGQGQAPTIITAISVPEGHSNPSRVAVTLPTDATVNVNSSVAPCSAAAFKSNACPPASQLGSVRAFSPLLPAPLVGPAVLLVTEQGFGVGLRFGPPVPLTLMGQTLISQTITNVFDGIPDLPLSRFELTVNGGGRGLLVNRADLCRPGHPAPAGQAQITGHSGATANVAANFQVVGCPARRPGSTATQSGGEGRPSGTLNLRFRRNRGTLRARFAAGAPGAPLSRLRLTLPRGLSAKKKYVRVMVGRRKVSKRSIRVRGRVLTVRLGRRATASLRWTRVKPSRSLARRLKRRPRLTFAARLTDATNLVTPLRFVVRPTVRRR